MSPNPKPSAPLVLGLSGMIGSGKSTVAELFEQLGATIIDADLLARDAVAVGTAGLRQVVATFGNEFLQADGSLDRKALGKLVFAEPEKRKDLEAIVHPRVRELFHQALSQARQLEPAPKLVLYVVPLLFEASDTIPEIRQTLLVCAPREQCLARIMQRDDCSLALASAKYDSQMPEQEKRKRADYVLENNAGLSELKAEVQALWQRLVDDLHLP